MAFRNHLPHEAVKTFWAKNGPTPTSSIVYFWSFQTNIIIIITINICEKCPSSIQFQYLNPQHESPLITTRPGLPPQPWKHFSWGCENLRAHWPMFKTHKSSWSNILFFQNYSKNVTKNMEQNRDTFLWMNWGKNLICTSADWVAQLPERLLLTLEDRGSTIFLFCWLNCDGPWPEWPAWAFFERSWLHIFLQK